MSKPRQEWRTHFFVLLPHPSEPSILMWPDKGGWSLPCVRTGELTWWRDVETVNAVIQGAFGGHVRALRCLSNVDDHSARVSHKVYLLENTGFVNGPIKGKWVGRKALRDLSLSFPEHLPMISEYLDEMEDGHVSYPHAPWMVPGWFEPVAAWFQEQLSVLGYTLVAPIEWVYSWPLSSILRAHTTTGDVYLKACSTLPLFADEPCLTSYLYTVFPGRIPGPLAVNQRESWMLLPDLGYPVRDSTAEEKAAVLDLFARMQLKSIGRVDELLRMGYPDLSLNKLEDQVELLLNADSSVFRAEEATLERFRATLPCVKEMWDQLSSYRIPHTLVHGDLHLGNVAFHEGRYLFFDWGQGCVSHPFFDIVTFFEEAEVDPEFLERYLTFWIRYESMDRLKEAWALAKPLGAIHNAIVYHHAIQYLGPEPEEMKLGVESF